MASNDVLTRESFVGKQYTPDRGDTRRHKPSFEERSHHLDCC